MPAVHRRRNTIVVLGPYKFCVVTMSSRTRSSKASRPPPGFKPLALHSLRRSGSSMGRKRSSSCCESIVLQPMSHILESGRCNRSEICRKNVKTSASQLIIHAVRGCILPGKHEPIEQSFGQDDKAIETARLLLDIQAVLALFTRGKIFEAFSLLRPWQRASA